MNIQDVVLDDFYKVESIGARRITIKSKSGKTRYYRSTWDIIQSLNNTFHGMVSRDSKLSCTDTTGQDVTKWFALELVKIKFGKRQADIPQYLYDLVNPSVQN